ncbi:MAG: mechanosensitive ion channel [Ignavibacteria bacterium]|nr:mechanosensitive ion channel [Ignavibacteria bacterium]
MTAVIDYLKNIFQDDLVYTIFLSALVFGFAYLLAKLSRLISKKIILPITRKTISQLDDQILEISASTIYRLFILGGFYAVTKIFRGKLKLYKLSSSKTQIEDYPFLEDILVGLEYVIYIFFIFILLILSFRIVTIIFDWYAEKINAHDNKDLSGSLFPLLNKISKILLTGLAIVILLSHFQIDISGFIVSLGVGSLAIALAAQETISNMISGFIVMIDRPFRIGDRIRIGNELVGDVVGIGIRSTKIMDFDKNIVSVPNNDIVKSRIVNLSYPTNATRVLIEVGVAYGSDINQVKSVLIEAAKSHPKSSSEIEPVVVFMRFGDSSIDLRLDVKTDLYSDAFMLGSDLREIIYKKFSENKIEIPFPQRVVHVKN